MTEENVLDRKYNFLRPIKINNLIRVGAQGDGGYVVDSSVIVNCNNLISFGAGFNQWSFELGLVEKNKNFIIHIYDYSVTQSCYQKEILSPAWLYWPYSAYALE